MPCWAIKKLGLLSRINNVEASSSVIMADHPKLFKGLGTLEGEYCIKLEPSMHPFVLSTPRQVAIPLMSKVKKELARGNGKLRDHIKSGITHGLVCRNGCCSKSQRKSTDMHRPDKIESKHEESETCSSVCQAVAGPARRCCHVFET